MENQLDLNLILKFLVNSEYTKKIPNKKENDKLHLNYLDFCNSSRFNFFKDVLNDHLDRIGIHKNNQLENSLYFSILYILYKDFCLVENSDQNYIIKTFKNRIKDDLLTRKFKLPTDLVKKKVVQKLKNTTNDYQDAYILSIFLNVNIFVLSYTEKKIHIFYKEKELNTYKKNIFFNEIDGIYYPLIYKLDNGRHFKYNSTILNNILFSDYVSAYNSKNNKEFIISNDWESILGDYLKINTSNIVIDLNESILNNMSDSESSDDDIDYDNLTEEIKYLNEKMESNNSDNLNLESSDDEDSNEGDEDNNENDYKSDDSESDEEDNKIKLIEELKSYSDYKLNKLKKDDLLNYLMQLTDISDSVRKQTKGKIITNLKKEIQKFI